MSRENVLRVRLLEAGGFWHAQQMGGGIVRSGFMALIVTAGAFAGCGEHEVASAQGGAGSAMRAGEGAGARSTSNEAGVFGAASGSGGGAAMTAGSGTSGSAGGGLGGSAGGGLGGGTASASGGADAEHSGGAAGDQNSAGARGDGGELACGDVANTSRVIEAVRIDVDPLAPAGGVIQDGVYHLESRIIYTGLGGPSGGRTEMRRSTQIIAGGKFELIGGDPSEVAERRSGTYQVDGTNLVVHTTCPGDTPDEVHPFTFAVYPAATTFNIYTAEGAETRVETWLKQ